MTYVLSSRYFFREPGGVFFRHVEDREGENGRVAVGVDFKDFFFYLFVVPLDGFTKEDHFIGFFNVILPRWPEIQRVHAGDDINAPRESLLEKMPPDVFGSRTRFTGDVDEDHDRHII